MALRRLVNEKEYPSAMLSSGLKVRISVNCVILTCLSLISGVYNTYIDVTNEFIFKFDPFFSIRGEMIDLSRGAVHYFIYLTSYTPSTSNSQV